MYIIGGGGADTGSSSNLELLNLGPNFGKVTGGEEDTDVADELIKEAGPLVVASGLAVDADGALHHGVLPHEDDGLRAEGLADVLELLGANIVGMDL